MALILRGEDNASYVLGEESLRLPSGAVREYARWIIALNGRPHPRVCPDCGNILQRMPIMSFKLRRRNFDLSISSDGYYIFSRRLATYVQVRLSVDAFCEIPGAKGFLALDHERLPVLEVDRDGSGSREGPLCPICQRPYFQLAGVEPGRPPKIRKVIFRSDPEPRKLYRSDMEFGSTHGRTPLLIVHSEEEAGLSPAEFKGLYIWP